MPECHGAVDLAVLIDGHRVGRDDPFAPVGGLDPVGLADNRFASQGTGCGKVVCLYRAAVQIPELHHVRYPVPRELRRVDVCGSQCGLVDPDRLTVGVALDDGVRNRREDRLQSGLVLARTLLHQSAFGEVEVGTDYAHDRAGGLPPHGKAPGENVYIVAVLVTKTELHLIVPLAPQDGVHHFAHPRPVLGMEQTLLHAPAFARFRLLRNPASSSSGGSRRLVCFYVPVPNPLLGGFEGKGKTFFACLEPLIEGVPVKGRLNR